VPEESDVTQRKILAILPVEPAEQRGVVTRGNHSSTRFRYLTADANHATCRPHIPLTMMVSL